MSERTNKEIHSLISEEMPELIELFDKKQLDALVNSLIVNDHTRRMSLKELVGVLKEARDGQIESAVETIKGELMKPEVFGRILDQVTPVKGKDYFTEQEKDDFIKKAVSRVRVPKAGQDFFTVKERSEFVREVYADVLDELLTRKEYSISAVDIDGITRRIASGIKLPDFEQYRPDTPEKLAKKLSTLENAIPVKVIKGAVTMEEVLKELKDPKGKNKLSAGDILNMPARGPLDQRWHGAGISEVTHDETLTGEGTPDSPLSVIGGGGANVEIPVGTVNGSNTVFTVSNTPKWVVSDSMTYFEGYGYTYLAGTITMDALIPPTTFIRSIY